MKTNNTHKQYPAKANEYKRIKKFGLSNRIDKSTKEIGFFKNMETYNLTKEIKFFIDGTLTTLNVGSNGELSLGHIFMNGQPDFGYNKISNFYKQLVLSNLNTNTPKEVLDVLFKLNDKDIDSKIYQLLFN